MELIGVRNWVMFAFLGCDKVKDITSGGGTKDADPSQSASGTLSGQSNADDNESGDVPR